MSHTKRLLFYASPAQQCNYLPTQMSVSLFVDPDADMTMPLYSRLIDKGFRRSGRYVYRPHCPRCHACVPTRIPVSQFRPNRSQKRNWNKNKDIIAKILPPTYQDDHYRLYYQYVNTRHAGGEMENPTPESYRSFLSSDWTDTVFIEFRIRDKLVGVAVTDVLSQGLSAVYTFYDPDQSPRGLGNFGVLWQIEEAKRRKLSYVYLGYWIADNKKMRYKSQFRPIEGLLHGQWQLLSL